VIDAVLGITGPGVTGSELVAVARQAAGGSTPWPAHFYLAHGVGLDSAEAPLVGTDMGPAADEALVLAPGMVLVFEPEVFDPATGGYRAEEVVVITDDGHRMLSDHHYRPYA
jgi:Xaa-Pro aminopeptidase